ncbi:MAG: MGDG synthase family glycosyltransferase [Bacillota bacterium]
MDVLFLSITMGSGHIRAAEALREYILHIYPNSRTLVVDTLKYINPLTHKLIVDGYLGTVRSNPQIYGKIYALSECKENINKLSKTISILLSNKIEKLVREFKPSIIVCTHPFPLQMISYLKKENKVNVPAIAILTDFVNHPFWFHDNIEAYIVGHDYIKMDMIRCGIPKDRIFSYGIPVSRQFLDNKPKIKAREALSLDNKLTMLIMGGSLGIGNMEGTFSAFVNCERDMQLIVVAGKNASLKRRLEEFPNPFNKKIKIIGYTNNIAELMDASDFVITKPGGMTISEALVKGLPIFIISPIPGQEERNAQFLINSGAAVRIQENENIDSILHQVLDNATRLRHMKEMAKELGKPDSGYNTVMLMEELIQALVKYPFYSL